MMCRFNFFADTNADSKFTDTDADADTSVLNEFSMLNY